MHNRLPLSMCVANPMWVAATLRGMHTNGHDAHPDHRHLEAWAYEVPHLTPGHVGHRRAGQLPLARPYYTCVLCFHEAHGHICKVSLHTCLVPLAFCPLVRGRVSRLPYCSGVPPVVGTPPLCQSASSRLRASVSSSPSFAFPICLNGP